VADYSIWVLEYSYVTNYHKSGVLYGAHNQGYVKLPYCYALIKGKNHVAMVDVGYNNKEYGKVLGDKFGVENWRAPKDVLAGVGLTPADVDTVSSATRISTISATPRTSRRRPSTFRNARSRSGSGPCRCRTGCAG
jgi:hypothetical protein